MTFKHKKFTIKKNQVITYAIFSSIVVAFIMILTGMSFYKYQISEVGDSVATEYNTYKYHYAMISENPDDLFWDAVYQGALEKGKEQDAYVEKLGSNLSVSYSLYDQLQIAIASKVHGIIIEPNGDPDVKRLINEADAAGIPVITVLKDEPQSTRKSFVGISSYELGQAYGRQVAEVVKLGRKKVTVLLGSDSKDTSQSIIYSSICEAVDELNVEVGTAMVNTQNTFSSEEDIRNLIINSENPPDVLVCLTADDTVCAYQAIVDYNKTGEIDIIGYYDSELILNAIQMDNIHSTLVVDTRQMGAYCVEALTEFKKTKRVSEFFSVNTSIISKNNVTEYMDANNQETIVK